MCAGVCVFVFVRARVHTTCMNAHAPVDCVRTYAGVWGYLLDCKNSLHLTVLEGVTT